MELGEEEEDDDGSLRWQCIAFAAATYSWAFAVRQSDRPNKETNLKTKQLENKKSPLNFEKDKPRPNKLQRFF